jgi:hypothetical protein
MVVEIFGVPWQDVVLSVGGFVGLYSKIYALYDSDTTWSRKSSIPNAAFFIPTIAAFYTLGLYLVGLTSTVSFFVWSGIAVWRAPDDEDWIGRTSE